MSTQARAALDLDAIRERAEAATSGPWLVDGPWFWSNEQVAPLVVDDERSAVAIAPSADHAPPHDDRRRADMAFIAAARTDVPALLDEIERLHTWAGLMSVVDEQYPVSVFPVQPDDNRDGDYGPRILSLLRRLDELDKPAAWSQRLFDQRDAALEAVVRVRKLHAQSNPPRRPHCTFCLGSWPCETIQALEEP